MYIVLGLITWVIILLVSWYDYEHGSSMDDMWDVTLIGGCVGGILSSIWPLTWLVLGMTLLTRWLYKGYQKWVEVSNATTPIEDRDIP